MCSTPINDRYFALQNPFKFERFVVGLTMAFLEGQNPRHDILTALISERGWWKSLGLTEDQGNNYRTRFKNGTLSEEKVKELLTLAGYKIVQEELWENPGLLKE